MESTKVEKLESVNILIELVRVLQSGMVKPYDPAQIAYKIERLKKDGLSHGSLNECCPESTEVRDTKDFKPYIFAALDKISEYMDLDVKNSYDR